MFTSNWFRLLPGIVVLAASVGAAQAATIGPNCASCNGGIYSLDFTNFQSGAVNDTLDIFLRINASNVSAVLGTAAYIDTVSVKVSSSVNASSALTAAPVGLQKWTTVPGGASASGCSGAGAGYTCGSWTGSGVGAPTNIGVLTWIFHLSIPTGTLDVSPSGASIKARYVNSSNTKIGALVSEDITLTNHASSVPEPSTFALCSAGLLVALWRARRK